MQKLFSLFLNTLGHALRYAVRVAVLAPLLLAVVLVVLALVFAAVAMLGPLVAALYVGGKLLPPGPGPNEPMSLREALIQARKKIAAA